MSDEQDVLWWMHPKGRAGNVAIALFLTACSAQTAFSFARSHTLEDQVAPGFLAVVFGLGAVSYAKCAARAKK
jgi:hypothetical protein